MSWLYKTNSEKLYTDYSAKPYTLCRHRSWALYSYPCRALPQRLTTFGNNIMVTSQRDCYPENDYGLRRHLTVSDATGYAIPYSQSS